MALMKFVSEATSEEIIADVVVPLALTNEAVGGIDVELQNPTATLTISLTDDFAAAADTLAATNSALNEAVEAGLNDPYNIPTVSELLVSQGYLEAPVVN